MHLSGLIIYPVKSLRGCAVTEAELDEVGLVGDRRFMLADETGRFLSQRTVPRMALLAPRLTADTLTITADGAGTITVVRQPEATAPLRAVSVWKSEGLLAEDCGDGPAKWLADFLDLRCRLVRIGPKFVRPVLKSSAVPGDRVSFADAYPFLAIGEGSLRDLNDRLTARGEEPVPMDRFRPNLVIAGSEPFAEDNWPRLCIGDIVLRRGEPCSRCVVTTTDQLTGERGVEPLRTLATYRRDPVDPTDVNFGQNFIHETKHGRLRVGDVVIPM